MQYSLFPEVETKNVFPSTRYQGSKAKFTDWIGHILGDLHFHTVLDAFGGTGSVAYMLKDKGKKVTYNDILPFNATIGKAIIENSFTRLEECEVDNIITKHPGIQYPHFISDNFQDIYYTDQENHWLDIVIHNIRHGIEDEYKKAIAWFALFQACIIKRPYNLFHRKNLYIRLSDVERSFGNKKTWDTPFETHFRYFVDEANRAIFNNDERCTALNQDALTLADEYDLVYIDTPYLNDKGAGVDYADFYHFLNGMLDYDNWKDKIDYSSKHRRLKRNYSIWNDPHNIINGFNDLVDNFKSSILVFSYRSNGIPTINSLVKLLEGKKRTNKIYYSNDIKYALSVSKSKEVLIVSLPD